MQKSPAGSGPRGPIQASSCFHSGPQAGEESTSLPTAAGIQGQLLVGLEGVCRQAAWAAAGTGLSGPP